MILNIGKNNSLFGKWYILSCNLIGNYFYAWGEISSCLQSIMASHSSKILVH